MGRVNEPLALYIHWPFCTSKCPYCDFNSHVREAGVDHARFAAALRAELAHEAARVAPGDGARRPLASIFFGGGTPSLMLPQTVAALIADATAFFEPMADIEITLEANPTSVELGKLRAFREAGVNRVSLGVQALSEDALRFLGRRHDASEAIAALELARKTFPRVSFDMIYARPGQSEAAWRAELRQALALAADHLSLYQLTIEPGTRFATEYARGAFALPEGRKPRGFTSPPPRRRQASACNPMRSRTTPSRGRRAGTTWRIGAMAIISASAPARISACWSMARCWPPDAIAAPRNGPPASNVPAMAAPRNRP